MAPDGRLYFTMSGKTVVLLLIGGDKSTQQRDIYSAKSYWKHQKEA
jgi:putative addiction module killer protein